MLELGYVLLTLPGMGIVWVEAGSARMVGQRGLCGQWEHREDDGGLEGAGHK